MRVKKLCVCAKWKAAAAAAITMQSILLALSVLSVFFLHSYFRIFFLFHLVTGYVKTRNHYSTELY